MIILCLLKPEEYADPWLSDDLWMFSLIRQMKHLMHWFTKECVYILPRGLTLKSMSVQDWNCQCNYVDLLLPANNLCLLNSRCCSW